MKNINKILVITFLISISSIFAFNNSLNETNITITGVEIINNTEQVIVDVNPYKNKNSKEIKFKDLIYKPKKGISDKVKLKSKDKDDKTYSLIQFNKNPTKSELRELKKEGIKLLSYISSDSWYGSINQDLDNVFETNDNGDLKLKNEKFNDKYLIRSIDEIKPEFKLSKYIKENKIRDWARDENGNVYLIVQFQNGVSLEIAENLVEDIGGVFLNRIETINALNILIPENKISDLSLINEVEWIETISPPPEDKLINSREIIKVDTIHSLPYNLSGYNVNILQYESGVPNNEHEDFENRVINPELFETEKEHATHVAGILVGAGIINNNYKGIAYNANLYSYEIDGSAGYNLSADLETDYEEGINNYDISIASNSWGSAINDSQMLGDYTLIASILDNIVLGNLSKKISIIWAAGNSRDDFGINYSTIIPKASAKNIISVGSINSNNLSISSFSSFGPTDAGRIKPEIVAPGCNNESSTLEKGITSTVLNGGYDNLIGIDFACGTSFSAPHVSGTIALMLEQWNLSGYTEDPLPSTIKALLLDSTVDLHRNGNGSITIDGPDYVNGYGLLNAKAGVDRIINGTFLEANISEEFDVDVYSINITNQNELKVTLVWDDPAGSILYNDLDLKLLSPSGITYHPWTLDPNNPSNKAVRNQSDHLNNLEQVYVNSSEIESGEWLVIVSTTSCTTDCPQKYSLVSEENISTELTALNADSSLITYLKLDNNALDSSNLSNHGIEYGSPSYNSNGHNNYSIIIDGVNDYVNLADKTEYHISDFTLSFWVKFDTINQPEYIFFKDRSGNYNGDFHIRTTTNNKIYVQLQTGSSQTGIESNLQLDSNWTHILFTSDGSTNNLYINGELDSSLNFNWNLNLNNLPIYIGSWAGSYVIDGEIDDFSFWNRSLENYEIAKLYQSNIQLSSSEAPSYEPLQVNSSLIGHYKLENNAQDSSNNNDGTSYGSLSYTTGYENTGADFDGINDYIKLNHSSMYQTSKISISFWLKLDNNDSDKYIFFKDRSGNYNGDFHIRTYDGDLMIQLQTGSSQANIQSNIPLSTTDWMHVVFTSDGSSNKLYINGLLDNSNSFSWNMNSNNLPIYLGGWAGNYGINGKMDEVSIWNTTLSSNEILRLYNEGIEY